MLKWFRDWKYIGMAKEYHMYSFYWIYRIYKCQKTGKIKKEKVYKDSQYEHLCRNIPMIHEIIEK